MRRNALSAALGIALAIATASSGALFASGCSESRARAQTPSPAPASAPADMPHAASGIASNGPRSVIAIARGSVEVPGGLVDIAAPQDGIVDSIAVREGDVVKRGQLLVQLSAEAQQHELSLAQAELDLARTRERAQQAKLPAATRQAQRLSEAARAEAVDGQRAEEAQQAVRDLDAALAVARAETAVATQKLSQVRSLAQRLAVRAPEDASVVRLSTQSGARVAAQGARPLLTLLPARALRIRAEVNESFVSRIAVGQRASVYLDSDSPGATALPGAKVARISPVFAAARLDDESPARGRVRVVECFLDFDQAPSLRVGQAVRVEFHE